MTPFFFIILTVLSCTMAGIAFLPFSKNESDCRKKILIGAALSLIPIIVKGTFSIFPLLESRIMPFDLYAAIQRDFWLLATSQFGCPWPQFNRPWKSHNKPAKKNAARSRDCNWRRNRCYLLILSLRIFTASTKPQLPTVITISIGLKFFWQSKHLAKFVS